MSRAMIPGAIATAWAGWRATVLNPCYWAFLAALTIVQLYRPARPEQRRPSRALAEDALWFVLSTALTVTVVAAVLAPLGAGYRRLTGGWHVTLTPWLGTWGVALLAFVLMDLLAWFTHWLHHHVPTLWRFHAVHHSQANLNVLSDNRQHVVEIIVAGAVAFVPARLLGLDDPAAIRLLSLTIYVSALIHANIGTNLGPLRHVLVSPQAHRIHHSAAAEHFNSNYGTVFIVWDLLFRTRHPDVASYPTTGIADPGFPHASGWTPPALVAMWARQTAHPFRRQG